MEEVDGGWVNDAMGYILWDIMSDGSDDVG